MCCCLDPNIIIANKIKSMALANMILVISTKYISIKFQNL